jgi:ribosomal subunit interface protein
MRTIIKATGSVELTPELRDYIELKTAMLAKYLGSADNELAMCEVEVGMTTEGQNTGKIYRAEFNLSYEGSGIVRYVAQATTMLKAIDKCKDEMKRELKRSHDKDRDMFRKGAASVKNFLRDLGG